MNLYVGHELLIFGVSYERTIVNIVVGKGHCPGPREDISTENEENRVARIFSLRP